jgi:hypothetical protein
LSRDRSWRLRGQPPAHPHPFIQYNPPVHRRARRWPWPCIGLA